MKHEKLPTPVRVGNYINIYKPAPDTYLGENTESFAHGAKYDEWICNDFSVCRDGNTWHLVGITHPRPKGFVDAFDHDDGVHEAEYQLFHCEATAEDFSDLMHEGSFSDKEKILYPSSRPNESCEIWAPHMLKREGDFEIVYSPHTMRSAATKDFVTFEKPRVLFEGESPVARDPYIYEENGRYYFLWLDNDGLMLRTSDDFENWSDAKKIYTPPFKSTHCESPFLMKKGEYYYLFWCIYDGRNGSYDNRTFVYAAKSLDAFEGTAPITMLDAHAPEVVFSNGKYYLLSVYYPNNGISAAELDFI